jgi:hypothetical protein
MQSERDIHASLFGQVALPARDEPSEVFELLDFEL